MLNNKCICELYNYIFINYFTYITSFKLRKVIYYFEVQNIYTALIITFVLYVCLDNKLDIMF